MQKIISMRAKKQLLAIFDRYTELAGTQSTSRPSAIVNFITYVANLNDTEAGSQLKAAAIMNIDASSIEPPQQIKIVIDIDDDVWTAAIDKFKKVFNLKAQPQMPYFLRVCGMAYLHYIEQYNVRQLHVKPSPIIDISSFSQMTLDEKLNEIYKLLLSKNED